MKVIKTKTGRIMLFPTLASMHVGQRWVVPAGVYKPATLRVACSNYGTAVNKTFAVSATLENNNKIIITRTR